MIPSRAISPAKRALDLCLALLALALTWPFLLLATAGIALTSPGPILYRARRMGQGGRVFTMYKLRTMSVNAGGDRITAPGDTRVFAWGRLLRAVKLDEIPQCINILRGEMSVVGPRPEDPELVARFYGPGERETLAVPPGLTSPGVLFEITHDVHSTSSGDLEAHYGQTLLPLKLALDRLYFRRAGFWSDLVLIARTCVILAARLAGRRRFAEPADLAEAHALLETPAPAQTFKSADL